MNLAAPSDGVRRFRTIWISDIHLGTRGCKAEFLLDFLRATDLSYVDRRYAGLTPAQYGCMLIVGYGVWQLARRREPSRTNDLVEAA